MKNVLLIWADCTKSEVMTFAIPVKEIAPYLECEDKYVCGNAGTQIVDKIVHLAHMIGAEPYRGDQILPLDEYLATCQDSDKTAGRFIDKGPVATPPWAKYRFEDNTLHNCSRILRTGWY